MTELTLSEIDDLRKQALALTMSTRLVGDWKAQRAYDLAEAFLTLTEPDPRVAIMDPSIMLASGRYFYFLKPDEFDWNINDVAHGLSNQCRFGGHPREFYPTAQHSVIASENVEPQFALEALLHDAHEFAYLDIMTPLKILLPDYRRLENHGEASMRDAYGLPAKMSPEVKAIDLRMLATEKRDLMAPSDLNWGLLVGTDPLEAKITPWGPKFAKRRFVERFWELWPLHLDAIRAKMADGPQKLPRVLRGTPPYPADDGLGPQQRDFVDTFGIDDALEGERIRLAACDIQSRAALDDGALDEKTYDVAAGLGGYK